MFDILGRFFHLYGLLIGIGILFAYEASKRYAKRIDVDFRVVDDGLFWAIVPGIIGARLYHVIDLWSLVYAQDLMQIIKVWEGGLGIYGGIIGGIIGLSLYGYIKRKNLLQLLDIAAIGVPLAQAIGRFGNYFNGELYGKNGEPLFLYESTLNLFLFMILWFGIQKKKHKKGTIFSIYLIGYGLIRFFLETYRPDEIIWTFNNIPMAQIISAIIILGGSGILYFSRD